jgi:hypothetical protein
VASSPVEYADASYPESKLVQDILSKEEHERLDNNLQFTCWAYGDKDAYSRSDARMLLFLLVVEGCEHLNLSSWGHIHCIRHLVCRDVKENVRVYRWR